MKRVRIIAALVAVALILTVAGCSEWRTTSDNNSDGEGSTGANQGDNADEGIYEDEDDEEEEVIERLLIDFKDAVQSGLFKDPTVGYDRVGTVSYSKGVLASYGSLKETVDNTELIVDVTITEWIGEVTRNESTFFRARVNNVIKGDWSDDTIVIRQEGDSLRTWYDFPLFKIGDRMVIFLVETTNDDGYIDKAQEAGILAEHETPYGTTVLYETTFFVQEYEGEQYLVSPLGNTIELATYFDEIKIGKPDEQLQKRLIKLFYESDYAYKYLDLLGGAYFYGEIEEILRGMAGEGVG